MNWKENAQSMHIFTFVNRMKRGAQYKKLVIIKLSLAGNNLIIPRQVEFGYSDIPAGTRKSCNKKYIKSLSVKPSGIIPLLKVG